MPSSPDFDEDIPTGITHLPQGAHVWAAGLTKDVRSMKPIVEEIHSDIKGAKLLLKLMPVAVAIAVGVVELLSWALTHVKLGAS